MHSQRQISLEKLSSYLDATPQWKIDKVIKYIESLSIDGPTLDEYDALLEATQKSYIDSLTVEVSSTTSDQPYPVYVSSYHHNAPPIVTIGDTDQGIMNQAGMIFSGKMLTSFAAESTLQYAPIIDLMSRPSGRLPSLIVLDDYLKGEFQPGFVSCRLARHEITTYIYTVLTAERNSHVDVSEALKKVLA